MLCGQSQDELVDQVDGLEKFWRPIRAVHGGGLIDPVALFDDERVRESVAAGILGHITVGKIGESQSQNVFNQGGDLLRIDLPGTAVADRDTAVAIKMPGLVVGADTHHAAGSFKEQQGVAELYLVVAAVGVVLAGGVAAQDIFRDGRGRWNRCGRWNRRGRWNRCGLGNRCGCDR